jgi:glycine cleavage system aminomethyltransferase T
MVSVGFSGVEAEYAALRDRAGLLDWSTHVLVEIEGRDRVDFLHRILTNDIKRLRPGHGVRAALVTANGKLVAELVVLAEADRHRLIVDATRAPTLLTALDRYLITEDVRLADRSGELVFLAVQGPASDAVLASAIGSPGPSEPPAHRPANGEIPVLLSHRSATLGETPVG